MEIDITQMIKNADLMPTLSGSIAELGENAGELTWNNSKEYARQFPLLFLEKDILEAKRYFKGFGAWTDQEIDEWSDHETNALLAQEIAERIREWSRYKHQETYEADAENGRISGGIFKFGDAYYIALY